MKKKVLFMTLAAAVVLAACGNKNETVNADAETAVEADAEEAAEEDTEEAVEAEEEALEEAAEELTEEEEQQAVTDADYTKGTLTETGWESEFLGLRFTAPEGMIMSTEEELAEMMGMSTDVLSEDFSEVQLELAKLTTVYEMMCMDETGATNAIITAEKLAISGVDAKTYADLVKKNLEQVTQITYNVSDEYETVELGGMEFTKMSCSVDYSGVKMYQDYYITLVGDRAVSVAVTYIDETAELAEQIVNGFEAY